PAHVSHPDGRGSPHAIPVSDRQGLLFWWLWRRPGEPDVLVELANGSNPGSLVRCPRRLEDDWRAERVEELSPCGWYNLRLFPRFGVGPGVSAGSAHAEVNDPGANGRLAARGLILQEMPMSEVTRILSAIDQGDPHAAGQLLPLVYDELRQLAARK